MGGATIAVFQMAKGNTSDLDVARTVGVLLVLQVAVVYLPFMQSLFGTAALSPRHWVSPTVIGLGIFAVVEVEKAVVRRWERRHPSSRSARATT